MRIAMKRDTSSLGLFLVFVSVWVFLWAGSARAQSVPPTRTQSPTRAQSMEAAKERAEKWAEKALTDTLTFTNLTAPDVFAQNRNKFSDAGWQDLSGFLQAADVLQAGTETRLDISAQRLEESALVIDVRDAGGNYYWEIELPFQLEIKSDAGRIMRKYIFAVQIKKEDSQVVIDQVKASKVSS